MMNDPIHLGIFFLPEVEDEEQSGRWCSAFFKKSYGEGIGNERQLEVCHSHVTSSMERHVRDIVKNYYRFVIGLNSIVPGYVMVK